MNYPEDFQRAVDDLIDNWEGTAYTKTPEDAGGGTKFGISSKSYPTLDIKNLTREDAVGIYYYDFWLKGGLDKVDPVYKAKVFNLGVLMGIYEAKLLLTGCSSLDM